MANVVRLRESVQYTGINGTYIAGTFLDGWTYTIISDDGTQLVMQDGEGMTKTIPLNGWAIRGWGHTLDWHGSNAAYQAQWVALA